MNLMESGIFMMEKRKQKYPVGKKKKLRTIRMSAGTINKNYQKARKNKCKLLVFVCITKSSVNQLGTEVPSMREPVRAAK